MPWLNSANTGESDTWAVWRSFLRHPNQGKCHEHGHAATARHAAAASVIGRSEGYHLYLYVPLMPWCCWGQAWWWLQTWAAFELRLGAPEIARNRTLWHFLVRTYAGHAATGFYGVKLGSGYKCSCQVPPRHKAHAILFLGTFGRKACAQGLGHAMLYGGTFSQHHHIWGGQPLDIATLPLDCKSAVSGLWSIVSAIEMVWERSPRNLALFFLAGCKTVQITNIASKIRRPQDSLFRLQDFLTEELRESVFLFLGFFG